MTGEERKRKIESYGRAHQALTAALKEFPKEMWQFRPAEGWSIHQILVHIADSEANSYVRCRRFIAEPGSAVLGYDTDKWAAGLRYESQGADDAVELFKWLRRASYNIIKALPASAWSNTINHSENGVMTGDDWLEVYERHIPEHVAQMRQVYEEWKAK